MRIREFRSKTQTRAISGFARRGGRDADPGHPGGGRGDHRAGREHPGAGHAGPDGGRGCPRGAPCECRRAGSRACPAAAHDDPAGSHECRLEARGCHDESHACPSEARALREASLAGDRERVDVRQTVRARESRFQRTGPQQRQPFRDCALFPPETESRARRHGVRCSYDGRRRADVKGRSFRPSIR
jgi:hypothetical protein